MNSSSAVGTIPIGKWGNSRGIRITKSMLEYLRAEDATSLEIVYENDGILLKRKTSRKTLEEYAAPYDGSLGPYSEFNWGEGLGFERWLDERD